VSSPADRTHPGWILAAISTALFRVQIDYFPVSGSRCRAAVIAALLLPAGLAVLGITRSKTATPVRKKLHDKEVWSS
jgi:hypothetical protein